MILRVSAFAVVMPLVDTPMVGVEFDAVVGMEC